MQRSGNYGLKIVGGIIINVVEEMKVLKVVRTKGKGRKTRKSIYKEEEEEKRRKSEGG